VFQKNDTDVAHYNFNAHQPILMIFSRDVAETAYYWMAMCDSTCPTNVLHYLGKHEPWKLGLFSHAV